MSQQVFENKKSSSMAHLTPVYLNIYDFTSLNSCFDSIGLGGYHTGIEIKGLQFCYFVCNKESEKTGIIAIEPESAGFVFKKKVFLGSFQIQDQKLEEILDELSTKYTCGNYHLFNRNCNHFSQQLVAKLLNIQIPKWIFRLSDALSMICCWLPIGLLSGQWALQMLTCEESTLGSNSCYQQQKKENQV